MACTHRQKPEAKHFSDSLAIHAAILFCIYLLDFLLYRFLMYIYVVMLFLILLKSFLLRTVSFF